MILLPDSFVRFTVKPYTPTIGAYICDLDLSQPIDLELAEELKLALAKFQVLFFEDQHLTPIQHIFFARIFGNVKFTENFFESDSEYPEIEVIESTATKRSAINIWHTDVSWQTNPPIGTCLYAKVIPPLGGDTIWSSMTAAYDSLDSSFKSYLETLTAVHTWEKSGWGYMLHKTYGGQIVSEMRSQHPSIEHPVIRVHPLTGKKIVYVNSAFTSHISGIPIAESDSILAELYNLPKVPEFQARLRWKENTLAVWDNRSTQHYAVADYFPEHRKLHRVTFLADQAF